MSTYAPQAGRVGLGDDPGPVLDWPTWADGVPPYPAGHPMYVGQKYREEFARMYRDPAHRVGVQTKWASTDPLNRGLVAHRARELRVPWAEYAVWRSLAEQATAAVDAELDAAAVAARHLRDSTCDACATTGTGCVPVPLDRAGATPTGPADRVATVRLCRACRAALPLAAAQRAAAQTVGRRRRGDLVAALLDSRL